MFEAPKSKTFTNDTVPTKTEIGPNSNKNMPENIKTQNEDNSAV